MRLAALGSRRDVDAAPIPCHRAGHLHVRVREEQHGLGDAGAAQERVHVPVGRERRLPAQVPLAPAAVLFQCSLHPPVAQHRVADPQLERVVAGVQLRDREAHLLPHVRGGVGRIHGHEPQRAGRLLPGLGQRRHHRVPDPEADARPAVGERQVVDLVVAGLAVPLQRVPPVGHGRESIQPFAVQGSAVRHVRVALDPRKVAPAGSISPARGPGSAAPSPAPRPGRSTKPSSFRASVCFSAAPICGDSGTPAWRRSSPVISSPTPRARSRYACRRSATTLRLAREHDRHHQHLERLSLEQLVQLRRRRRRVAGQALGDHRPERHGRGHHVLVAAADLQAVEPFVCLVAGQPRAQAGEPHERPARLGERSLHRLLGRLDQAGGGVCVDVRVKCAVETQLGHALERRAHVPFRQQVEQLVAQPRR